MPKQKLLSVMLVSLALSACSNTPSQPRIWKMRNLPNLSSYDHHAQKLECAYEPDSLKYGAMGFIRIYLPQGENICPRYGKFNPDTERFEFIYN
ncbi:hypothetical protein ACWIUH_03645 [Ursidibacter arcticus]